MRVPAPIEIEYQSVVYRCYRTTTDGSFETYIVAGVGMLTIDRARGRVVQRHAVIRHGEIVLEKIAVTLHARQPLPR